MQITSPVRSTTGCNETYVDEVIEQADMQDGFSSGHPATIFGLFDRVNRDGIGDGFDKTR